MSSLVPSDFNFLSKYCLWWHFFRISSLLEKNFSKLLKIVPRYLHSSTVSTGSPWLPQPSVSENVTIISLVLFMLSSRHEFPHHSSKFCRAELWCVWPESKHRSTVSSANFTVWQFCCIRIEGKKNRGEDTALWRASGGEEDVGQGVVHQYTLWTLGMKVCYPQSELVVDMEVYSQSKMCGCMVLNADEKSAYKSLAEVLGISRYL